jgi:hypothetical protein
MSCMLLRPHMTIEEVQDCALNDSLWLEQVVSRADAIMDAAREKQVYVDATHETICNIESQKVHNFRTVVSGILALAGSAYLWLARAWPYLNPSCTRK